LSNLIAPLQALESLPELMQELETLLADYLGTFSNGNIALWAEPPFIDAQLSCNGLQVVVGRYPEYLQPDKACVGSPQKLQRLFWRVTLVQFDPSVNGMTKLDGAIAAIERRFPLLRKRSPESREDRFPQVTYLLDFSRITNLSL